MEQITPAPDSTPRRSSPRFTYVHVVEDGDDAPSWPVLDVRFADYKSVAIRFNDAYITNESSAALKTYDFSRFEEVMLVKRSYRFTKPYVPLLAVCVFIKRDVVEVAEFRHIKTRMKKLFPPEKGMDDTRVTIYVPNPVPEDVRMKMMDRLLVYRDTETFIDVWDECPLTKERMANPAEGNVGGGYAFHFVYTL